MEFEHSVGKRGKLVVFGFFFRIGEVEEFDGELFYILFVIGIITMSKRTADILQIKIKKPAV